MLGCCSQQMVLLLRSCSAADLASILTCSCSQCLVNLFSVGMSEFESHPTAGLRH